MRKRMGWAMLLVAVVGLLAVGSAAAAGGAAADQYGAEKPVLTPPKQGAVGGTTVSSVAPAKASSPTLPFTGVSLASTVVLGAGLVGIGLMLRRRRQTE